MQFEAGQEFARKLDREDPLARFRDEFSIPTQANGSPEIYLCGNSLGLQPRRARDYVNQELDKWAALGVKGHFDCDFPWMPYHEFLAEASADLVGAQTDEVVVMNSLTVNLHLMMVSFYRPTKQRYKIVIEDHAFPSDHYAVESQLRYHGIDPADGLLLLKPRAGEDLLRFDDIAALIEEQGDSIALMLLPGVQYYTGQVLPMAELAELAHRHGIRIGLDLAHAVGNIPLQLHDWNVDFACWCSYKYLNSGPGSVAGCFVHRRHAQNTDLPRFAGWWGHDKQTRFRMENRFQAIPTAEGWQLSNPPILSLAAIRASLDIYSEAGGMEPLRRKSEKLTAYLQFLLKREVNQYISIITPEDPEQRGCQLSLCCDAKHLSGRELFQRLEENGVTCDWREPNVIRVAPVPLYNRFEDIFRFVDILKTACNE
ncbi:Kynureninase [Microbulbifer donghaiensis]|uniref:Kynureninase n=1 Tax=Microbulbifer donghaiensis TaxID=494016 RepID=A0A1M5CEP9_9GAMM|nr:kynureninase [Microbulbifer donghaiensis]SHF53223.1 Kynureninase [Microbulbifer donghaiensis]